MEGLSNHSVGRVYIPTCTEFRYVDTVDQTLSPAQEKPGSRVNSTPQTVGNEVRCLSGFA